MLFLATILRRFVRYKGMLVNFIFSKGMGRQSHLLVKGLHYFSGVVEERRGFRESMLYAPFQTCRNRKCNLAIPQPLKPDHMTAAMKHHHIIETTMKQVPSIRS